MSKSHDRRIVGFVLIMLLGISGLVYAAVPGDTLRTTAAGVSTLVVDYLNSTYYYIGGTDVTGYIQNADPAGDATLGTLDTGQGANELYDMDQNVLTTSDVNFSSVEADDIYARGIYNVTQLAMYPQQPASYIIWGDPPAAPTIYYAKNGTDGSVTSNVNRTALQETILGSLTEGMLYLRDVQFNTSLTRPTNVVIVEQLNGVITTIGTNTTINGVVLRDGAVLPEGQIYGVQWNQGTDTWTQIDIDGATITPTIDDFNNHEVWGSITRVNLAPDGTINARYGDGDYASNGSNGEVMVEIPAFYVRGEQLTSGVYQWWISGASMTGFELHPAFLQRDGRPKAYIYVGAYEASLMVGTGAHDADTTLKLHTRDTEQPWTGGEIDALPYDTGTVEFTRGETLTGAISGGDGEVIDWTLTGGTWGGGNAAGTVYIKQNTVNFQAEGVTGSVSGACNATGIQVAQALTIGNARTYGGNHGAGWGIMNIWSLSAVKLLFIVEYGNMDSQTEIGRGVVDLPDPGGVGYNGLETAAAGVDGNLDAAGTGVGTGPDGDVPATYRYMENLWGNVWSFIDGYNAIDAEYRIINRDGDGTFADALATYEASSMVPITTDGYISDIEWDRLMKYLFIPSDTTGGSSSTYIPDYQYSHDAGETNILLAGGIWAHASSAGLGDLHSMDVASDSKRYFGARAEYVP